MRRRLSSGPDLAWGETFGEGINLSIIKVTDMNTIVHFVCWRWPTFARTPHEPSPREAAALMLARHPHVKNWMEI
ncbi:hypothetical protein PYR71_22420 [Rhizobium sp. MC63]|uniref:Uncharacterized protein n=1 Tax=Rhizobium mulingense TaxID=3031128 RepID=A0ACC6N234_9HYPH|nr:MULTISPECIES: hypothetical protein [unclassified Rhizobium]MDF0699211.1 hypothetical protein [Rhizobium sp. MC63]MEA3519530.1 hypothetical protein [Rhizobium sp. MJ31]MEB3046108.1 hypothetical protein [Rhizobium sp. MJ21]